MQMRTPQRMVCTNRLWRLEAVGAFRVSRPRQQAQVWQVVMWGL